MNLVQLIKAKFNRRHTMLKRCKKIFPNGKQCSRHALPDQIYCEKHKHPSTTTYSIGQTKFSGKKTEMRYEEYIKTDQWKNKAKKERIFWNHKCALCHRSSRILHVHHSTYVRLGYEEQGDLIVLCEDCHKLFHKHYTYSGATGTFILIRKIK